MIVGTGHLHGPVIPVHSLQIDRADLLGPVVPTSSQLAVPWFISHVGDYFVDGNLSENGSYLGIPLLVLLVVIIRRLRRDATVVTFSWLALVAFVLSLGSFLVIGTWHSRVPLPEDVFTRLPLLQDTIPARYSLYVLLFASMIVGIGLDRLLAARREAPTRTSDGVRARLRARAWTPRTRVAVAAAVIVVSLLPAVPFHSRGLLWPASLTTAVKRVVPPGSVVLTYPFATPLATQPMAWQAIDDMEFRIVGGYANIPVPGQSVGERWPLLIPPASVQELLGYTSVGDRYPQPPIPTPAVQAQLRQFLKRYSIGAVVAWTGSGNPDIDIVMRSTDYLYLKGALGRPQVQGDRFAIWLKPHGGWPSTPS